MTITISSIVTRYDNCVMRLALYQNEKHNFSLELADVVFFLCRRKKIH